MEPCNVVTLHILVQILNRILPKKEFDLIEDISRPLRDDASIRLLRDTKDDFPNMPEHILIRVIKARLLHQLQCSVYLIILTVEDGRIWITWNLQIVLTENEKNRQESSPIFNGNYMIRGMLEW